MNIVSRETPEYLDEHAHLRRSIELILVGKDHRELTNTIINKEFLSETIEFFKRIVDAKLAFKSINLDWYKETFLKNEQNKNLVAAYGGLALKSINNKRKTTKREVVLEESLNNYDTLLSTVNELCDSHVDIDLAITFNGVTVHLNLNESLIAINALAVRRNQIRGGNWSSLGKRIEFPLLKALCILFRVPESNYSKGNRSGLREIDFCLIDGGGNLQKCEVKLMGKGNPEGADSLYARGANVFVASKLSDTNIKQLNSEGVEWVELNKPFGFLKFADVLAKLNVPHEELTSSKDDLEILIRHATNRLTTKDFN